MKNRSVTQSYLLCTLKERNRLASYSAEKGMCLVAGSVLELLLDGVLAFDGKRLTAAAPLPPEKEYLAPVYGFVGEKQPVKPEKVIENFSLQFTNRNLDALLEHVGASLEAAGCARREQGGLLGGKTVYVPEPAALDAAVQEIRAELLEDGAPTEDIAALTLLLDRSGDLAKFFSAYEKKDLKKRLKALENDPQYVLIKRVADYVEALLVMIVVAAT